MIHLGDSLKVDGDEALDNRFYRQSGDDLSSVLAALGLESAPSDVEGKRIIRHIRGEEIGLFDAAEAWAWVRTLPAAHKQAQELRSVVSDYLEWADPTICRDPALRPIRMKMRALTTG